MPGSLFSVYGLPINAKFMTKVKQEVNFYCYSIFDWKANNLNVREGWIRGFLNLFLILRQGWSINAVL